MAKQQLHIRVSAITRTLLDALVTHHGTLTEAVAVAIDRLYREEFPSSPAPESEIVETGRQQAPD